MGHSEKTRLAVKDSLVANLTIQIRPFSIAPAGFSAELRGEDGVSLKGRVAQSGGV